MDAEEIVEELYALRPEEFVAARDARAAEARKAKDTAAAKRIAGLRRPTVAAWASNRFVRSRPEDAERLRALGATLREAHRTLDAATLRQAAAEQHRMIAALVRETAKLARDAGHPLTESAQRELEQIFHAVLGDPDAADQWATGTLARAPEAVVGFGTVAPEAVDAARKRSGAQERSTAEELGSAEEPAPARAEPRSARARKQDPERRRRLARARAADKEAAEEARRLHVEREAAEEARQAARDRVTEADERVARLEEELREARDARREARAAADEADTAAKDAARAAQQAHRTAERAARALARLSEGH
ncbi:hypothetical protein ACIQ6Y_00270 [Streptomyces sp. NPDC096205]|uniref:hypothetical protein n=1 Tax=Streptomyces sp. NPDC096205 TaxID=3366081 RepID=UPI0037F7DC6D